MKDETAQHLAKQQREVEDLEKKIDAIQYFVITNGNRGDEYWHFEKVTLAVLAERISGLSIIDLKRTGRTSWMSEEGLVVAAGASKDLAARAYFNEIRGVAQDGMAMGGVNLDEWDR